MILLDYFLLRIMNMTGSHSYIQILMLWKCSSATGEKKLIWTPMPATGVGFLLGGCCQQSSWTWWSLGDPSSLWYSMILWPQWRPGFLFLFLRCYNFNAHDYDGILSANFSASQQLTLMSTDQFLLFALENVPII